MWEECEGSEASDDKAQVFQQLRLQEAIVLLH